METPSAILRVHSLTEAQMQIWVARCRRCGSGPLVPGIAREEAAKAVLLTVPTTCRPCGAIGEMRFEVGDWAGCGPTTLTTLDQCPSPPGQPINPTEEHSRAIDVAGWLTLEALLGEKARQAAGRAENAADRAVVRQWQILAGACIEEALKFYEEDNDLPPTDAFFHESSRTQFRERPAMFTRERLLHLRAQRPMPTAVEHRNPGTSDGHR